MADGNTTAIPAVRIGTPLVNDWAYLAARMRPDEQAQFAAVSGFAFEPDLAAQTYVAARGLKYVLVGRDGLPFAAGCFEQVRPGAIETWGIGTPEAWGAHWRAMTKVARRQIDALLQQAACRVQIISLTSRREAHAWYERGLGMQREGTLRAYFADGSDAVVHARVRGDQA